MAPTSSYAPLNARPSLDDGIHLANIEGNSALHESDVSPGPSSPYVARRHTSRTSTSSAAAPRKAQASSSDHPASDVEDGEGSDYGSESDEEALMLCPSAAHEDESGGIELPSRKRRRGRRGRAAADERAGAQKYDEDDPLFLVSKAVSETDDPTLPALTIRVILIGGFLAVIGAAVSQLFFYKSNSPSFSSYFIILVSLPMGIWLARALPDRLVRIGPLEFSLNPGAFSIKEHLLIAVLASSGATSAYASDILSIQNLFFHQDLSTIGGLTLLITTQTLGFGFAGLVHNLLVKPPAMLYPSTLVTTTLYNTLHSNRSHETRPKIRFFVFAFMAVFLYQFLPSLLMPTLTSIAVLCIINNNNSAFRALSSGYKGFGVLNFSLDWNAVGAMGPLSTPWWAAVNFYVGGLMFTMWLLIPALYFSDWWDAKKFPAPLGSGLFNSTFGKFEVSQVLKPDNSLDEEKWQEKAPLLLTPQFALTYGISFASLTSVIIYVFLHHMGDIKRAMSHAVHDDIHNRLMQAYQPVPTSWYLSILGVSLGAAVLLVATSPLQLPVWALLLAVAIALVFLVPVGIVRAVSDTSIGLNVITEFVAGYLLPGKPIANVTFKCYGYMAMAQALDLVGDMKLAHYMKIPPRHMFITQVLGTVIGCVVNYMVIYSVITSKRAFLDGSVLDPTGQWDGRSVHIFYSASIIWGAVGPAKFFSGKYHVLYWGFLIGLLAPFIPWFLQRRFPKAFSWDKIAFPLIFHGAAAPPQVPTNIIFCGFVASYMSQVFARKRHPRWFEKYNYVLAAALDAGSSINALVIFLLSTTLLRYLPIPNWWGNPATDAEHCTPS